jgi:dUTP pyrophosphatase
MIDDTLHKLKIKLLRPDAKVPTYAHPGEDAAFDIYSCEEHTLEPGEKYTFKVGIASEFPSRFWLKFEGKSGHADRNHIGVLGGVIDAYRGEWGVMLINHHKTLPFRVMKGMAIAPGVIHYKPLFSIAITDELSDSSRGAHGFGSGHSTTATA